MRSTDSSSAEARARVVRPRPTSPAAILCRDVHKRFGRCRVLRGLDLEVGWGEAVALLGPNGSGKSTLLALLASALTPSRGQILIAGQDPAVNGDVVRRNVTLLAGANYLYDDLTAAENLRFAIRMCGLRPHAAEVSQALARVGLPRENTRRIRTFSTGMRKRLALARALACHPKVLLLDEPFASLDEDGQGLVHEIIQEWRHGDRAVLIATHRSERVRPICDRIVELSNGRLVERGNHRPPPRLEVV